MSTAQAITTESNGREMSRQTSAKQANAKTQHKRTKRLMVSRKCRQTLAAKAATTLYGNIDYKATSCNLRISREFRFIQFVYHCQKYPKQNMQDSVKIRKRNFKIGRRSLRSFECAECGYNTLLFCKERQRNEQRVITHTCRTAILLVAVCLFTNSL